LNALALTRRLASCVKQKRLFVEFQCYVPARIAYHSSQTYWLQPTYLRDLISSSG